MVTEVRTRARRAAPLALAAVAVALAVPDAASARARTLHLRYGPITLNPAELKATPTRVRTPQVRGFVTRMHAYVVDARGRRLPTEQVMLHHAVFRRQIKPRFDRDCNSRRDTEPFYATGEEDETLQLPPGYGLRVTPHDRWRLRWMLMNHTNRRFKTFIRYDVRVERSRRIVPVQPLWMRVVNCRDEYFDVPGTGGPGSVFTQSRMISVGRTGRIVAATGHLHGGALGLTLSAPRCGGRTLLTTTPVYRPGVPRPEDGPIQVTSFASTVGIPVFRSMQLALTATYDNSTRHDQVMGTLHVYVAYGRPPSFDCAAIPPP